VKRILAKDVLKARQSTECGDQYGQVGLYTSREALLVTF
jgi:hypothetical protein